MQQQDAGPSPLWRVPAWPILLCALCAALLHLLPVAAGTLRTPEGWTFTGSTSGSPDVMQYRIWMRQSQESGLLVRNTFTSEPNPPHLLVLVYWTLGQLSRASGLRPELVYELAGVPFAFLLTCLIWMAVAHFGKSRQERGWVFALIMLAGGLGAFANLAAAQPFLRDRSWFKALMVPVREAEIFEDYRSHYVLPTLFDTHFLIIWFLTLLAVLLAYDALARPSLARKAAALLAFGAATLIHIYDGVVLVAALCGVAFVAWRKREPLRPVLELLGGALLIVGALGLMQVLLWKSGGLPMPTWREVNILFSTLLIAYPLAWFAIARWGAALWLRSDFASTFLAGWALGLTAMTLSGPFYAYPSRGTMTLPVVLYLIAGTLYFAESRTPSRRVVALVVALILPMPLTAVHGRLKMARFQPDKAYAFVDAEHMRVVEYLRAHAGPSDVLLFDKRRQDWKTDDLWLAPSYPGVLYVGHFFLTVDFETKKQASRDFYARMAPAEQAEFLARQGIRYVYAGVEHDLARLDAIEGLQVAFRTEGAGAVLEFTAPGRGRP